jgi:hypothetical protein
MKRLTLALCAALALSVAAPALSQYPPEPGMGPNNQYGDPVCGAWVNDVWQPNGQCPGYAVGPRRARVAGTIVFVRGHLVTLQLSDRQLTINDMPALQREETGRVAVGRAIVAYGYWRDGNFYATYLE